MYFNRFGRPEKINILWNNYRNTNNEKYLKQIEEVYPWYLLLFPFIFYLFLLLSLSFNKLMLLVQVAMATCETYFKRGHFALADFGIFIGITLSIHFIPSLSSFFLSVFFHSPFLTFNHLEKIVFSSVSAGERTNRPIYTFNTLCIPAFSLYLLLPLFSLLFPLHLSFFSYSFPLSFFCSF